MRIAEEELAARRSAFAATLAERELDGAVLFDPQYVHYYTGFFFVILVFWPLFFVALLVTWGFHRAWIDSDAASEVHA